jgi:hypothetical protein
MFSFFDDDSNSSDQQSAAPGQVQFDARGNATYAWRDDRLTENGAHAERLREKALRNAQLALVDDRPAVVATEMWNDRGLQVGYNPYESGLLAGKKPVAKKTDIRELSKWIEMKRRMDVQPAKAKK